MDLSSLPEEERQRLQQLQELFKQHQQQKLIRQQQQQEEEELQKQREIQRQYQGYAYQYDSSQCPWKPSYVDPAQSYDCFSQAYYQYYYQQEHDRQCQEQQQQSKVHGVHLQDYANAAHHQYQQSAEVQPGLRHLVEADAQLFKRAPVHQPVGLIEARGVVADVHWQNAHHLEQGVVEVQSAGTAAYPGLSPAAAAAVAALSQLSEFAGKMGVSGRAPAGLQQGRQLQGTAGGGHEQIMSHTGPVSDPLDPPANQFQHSGGGRKGIEPIRNGNRGARFDGRACGRGHGHDQGQTGSGHGHSAKNAPSSSAIVPGVAVQDRGLQTAVPTKAAAVRRPPQVLKCEICKLECNSAEILEQHKNGKKHKKNVEKIEELRKANNPLGETKNGQTSASSCNMEIASLPEILHRGGESRAMPANLAIKEATGGSSSEALGETEAALRPASTIEDAAKKNKRKGMKQKQRNGHEPKRMRVEPRVPKVMVPFVCDVCNIKCDTQEVLNCHLAGKKHIIKVNRLQGNRGMVQSVGLQALYPPNPISQNLLHPQPQALKYNSIYGQLEGYPQPATYMLPSSDLVPAAHGNRATNYGSHVYSSSSTLC